MGTKSETFVFEYFKENYKDFPEGQVIYQDKPDYLIKTFTKLIGVEITEAVIDPKELSRYRLRVSITDDILDQLKDKLPFTFCIDVDLKKDVNLSLKKKREVISELIDLCCKECISLQNLEFYNVWDFGSPIENFPVDIQNQILAQGYRNLPDGILEISLGRYDDVGKSWNSASTAIVAPNFNFEKLKPILKKKEIKLRDYTKCDEHWLLIWGSGLPDSYYSKVQINYSVETEFNKIFFVRLGKDITEIKLK
jgi:hypothetical protein